MRSKTLVPCFLLAITTTASAHPLPKVRTDPPLGQWQLRLASPSETGASAVVAHVALRTPGLNTLYVPFDKFEGLTAEQIESRDGPVRFTLKEDAGDLQFEGTFQNGAGTGRFSFAPSMSFVRALELRKMERPTLEQQFDLARHEIGLDLIDELAKNGYRRPRTAEILRAGINGVDASFVRDLAALGYRLGTVDALVRLTVESVDAAFVRTATAAAGRTLSVDELLERKMRGDNPNNSEDSGRWTITAAQTASPRLELLWRDGSQWKRSVDVLRLPGLEAEQLGSASPRQASFRIQQDAGQFYFDGSFSQAGGNGTFHFKPNRDFARTLQSLGIRDLGEVSDRDLMNLAFGDMSASALRQFIALGFNPMTKEEMMDLAVQHVTPEFVRDLRKRGVKSATVAEAVEARMFGVRVYR